MKKTKKKRVTIKTPFPTVKEVAKELGVKMKRVKEIEKMMDKIVKGIDAKRMGKIKAGSGYFGAMQTAADYLAQKKKNKKLKKGNKKQNRRQK